MSAKAGSSTSTRRKAHFNFAVLAEEVGFWECDKYWVGEKKATDETNSAVARADGEMEKLERRGSCSRIEILIQCGSRRRHSIMVLFLELGRCRGTLRIWIGRADGIDAAGT